MHRPFLYSLATSFGQLSIPHTGVSFRLQTFAFQMRVNPFLTEELASHF
jgi:hypothetical protein